MKKAMLIREIRMSRTIFLVCFSYYLFVILPVLVGEVMDVKSQHPLLMLGLYFVYWSQYSINFFIYAARSEQYRKAYVYFLKKVIKKEYYLVGYTLYTSCILV